MICHSMFNNFSAIFILKESTANSHTQLGRCELRLYLDSRYSSVRCCRRRVEIWQSIEICGDDRQSLEICGDNKASYNRDTL